MLDILMLNNKKMLNNTLFTEDEIHFIQREWFPCFNGTNLDIKSEWPNKWNPLYMHLFIIHRYEFDSNERQKYINVLIKLLYNPKYNFNLTNSSGSTIISNLIQLWNYEALETILKYWNNVQCKYWESKFWDTYIDLALANRNKNPKAIDKIISLLSKYE